MDEQQQQRINEAAQQFTNALVESYRAVSGRAVSAQEPGVQLTQDFFNRVVNNLCSQAENTRQIGQELAGQQQRQWGGCSNTCPVVNERLHGLREFHVLFQPGECRGCQEKLRSREFRKHHLREPSGHRGTVHHRTSYRGL